MYSRASDIFKKSGAGVNQKKEGSATLEEPVFFPWLLKIIFDNVSEN